VLLPLESSVGLQQAVVASVFGLQQLIDDTKHCLKFETVLATRSTTPHNKLTNVTIFTPLGQASTSIAATIASSYSSFAKLQR
jgi:hypothetical protein